MKHRLFQIIALVSLLLCVGALLLWDRSHFTTDVVEAPVLKNWAWVARAEGGTFLVSIVHHKGLIGIGELMYQNQVATGLSPVGEMHHHFAGFGCGIWASEYILCVPFWFVAALFLLCGFLFLRGSRRKLNEVRGFDPILPDATDQSAEAGTMMQNKETTK